MKTQADQNEVVLFFEDGILGFEDIKHYKLIFSPEIAPFILLQSAQCERPCFIVCDPVQFVPGYRLQYSRRLCEELKVKSDKDIRFLSIVTIPENIRDITINLKSPIVLNIRNNMAKQWVTDEPEYPIKYRIINDDRMA